jgi:hypothetical protein
MRLIITLFSLFLISLIATNSFAANSRSPQQQVAIENGNDKRNWITKIQEKSLTRILIDRVPEGKSFESPVEVVKNQITFTPATLNNYLKIWYLQQIEADPEFKIIKTIREKQTLLLIYQTPANNRVTIRKIFKGSDGIYTLSYQVREDTINYDIYDIWLNNIKTSTLGENPE